MRGLELVFDEGVLYRSFPMRLELSVFCLEGAG